MARRRKRKSVNWTPVLWTALVANIFLGLLLSPATSVRKLRILGAQAHDTQRLNSIAQTLRGVPFMLVPNDRVESAVLASRDVYSASLSHNLFGSGILRVEYRHPVAQLINAPRVFLDDQGVLYGSPEPMPGIRQLQLDPEYLQPVAAFSQAWPSVVVADLCKKIDSFGELKGTVVHLDTTGRLWLSGEDVGKVDLGGSEQLDEKLRKLRHLLDDDPKLLTRLSSLSLTDPSHPALEVRKGASR